tara:strand:- start:152 stop:433 length:282 start_codon:yes stop_codon:yes gene_type:complete
MAETPFERSSTAGNNRAKRDGSVLSGTPARGYTTNKIEPEAQVAVKEEIAVTITTEEPETTGRKRARTSKGHYKSDDPSTPDVNEAYVVDSSE